jgi:uracil phosphoribosyltransferase
MSNENLLAGTSGQATAKAMFKNVTEISDNRYVQPILERMYNPATQGSEFAFLASNMGEELGRHAWHNVLRAGEKVALVPILNSGMFLWKGVHSKVKPIQVCPIDMERKYNDDRSIRVEVYKSRLRGKAADHALILEPMIATGASALDALKLVSEWGPRRISILSVLCAPQGLAAIEEAYPNVKIVTGKIAGGLDENSYIIDPGIGDFGDRCCGVPSH